MEDEESLCAIWPHCPFIFRIRSEFPCHPIVCVALSLSSVVHISCTASWKTHIAMQCNDDIVFAIKGEWIFTVVSCAHHRRIETAVVAADALPKREPPHNVCARVCVCLRIWNNGASPLPNARKDCSVLLLSYSKNTMRHFD